VVPVACEDQKGRDNVVREHLPIVFSLLLDVDDHNLLEPKGVLDEGVPFPQPSHLSIGPIGPKILEIQPIIGVDKNVLVASVRI